MSAMPQTGTRVEPTVHVCWNDGDPPPRGQVDLLPHGAYAEALKAQPGRWAVLPDLPASAVPAMKDGAASAYRPAGAFEAVVRNGQVYARYVGGAQ